MCDSSKDVDFEDKVARVTGEALATNRLRLTDKRLLIVIFIVIIGVGALDYRSNREFAEFRKAIVRNCEETNESNMRGNEVLDQLAKNAITNPARTPIERQQIATTYRQLRLSISTCPKV